MNAILELIAAIIWFIWLLTALVWLWEWARARATLDPLVKELQEAIRGCEEARLGLGDARRGQVGTICPRCGKTVFIETRRLGEARYCVYCGSALVAR